MNINSMSQGKKFDFSTKFITQESVSFLALTELTKDGCLLNRLLAKHDVAPIISGENCPRVGLMVPKFLQDSCEILDMWCVSQLRTRTKKMTNLCQTITIKIQLSTKIVVLTVVYCAPDANVSTTRKLISKIAEYAGSHKNYVVLGDFNTDWKIASNRSEYRDGLGGILHQVVSQVTRESIKVSNGKQKKSQTTIDLVFVSPSMKKLMKSVDIIKDTPSDHFLVDCTFDVAVPQKYVTRRYFLDPTR